MLLTLNQPTFEASPAGVSTIAAFFIMAHAPNVMHAKVRLLEVGMEPKAVAYPRPFEAAFAGGRLFGLPLIAADVETLEVIVR